MAKHKYIETPEKLWELFQGYQSSLKPREIQKATAAGVKSEFHTPPLTMEGFENYCEDNICFVHQYFVNQNEAYNEYMNICSRIKRKIRQDQIEGGMVGQFNPSITQRLNSLTEKTDVTSQGEKINKIEIEIIRSRSEGN
jgi:DNA polymerase II small subunit/DNA polymerase delta subunit B